MVVADACGSLSFLPEEGGLNIFSIIWSEIPR